MIQNVTEERGTKFGIIIILNNFIVNEAEQDKFCTRLYNPSRSASCYMEGIHQTFIITGEISTDYLFYKGFGFFLHNIFQLNQCVAVFVI